MPTFAMENTSYPLSLINMEGTQTGTVGKRDGQQSLTGNPRAANLLHYSPNCAHLFQLALDPPINYVLATDKYSNIIDSNNRGKFIFNGFINKPIPSDIK